MIRALLPYLLPAAAVILVASHAFAYVKGRADERTANRIAIAEQREATREAMAKLEAARLAIVAERAAHAQELEDAANADPVLVPQCLSPGRVRRLEEIR